MGKLHTWGLLFMGLLFSCANEDMDPQTNPGDTDSPLVSKEIYYNVDTGGELGEKTFTYDANGNVILMLWDDNENDQYNIESSPEVKYEYDGDQHLIRMSSFNVSRGKYFHQVFTYENGVKVMWQTFYDTFPGVYLNHYYYTGTILDSVRHYANDRANSMTPEYRYLSTTLYEVDALGEVTREYDRRNGHGYEFYYEKGKLKETCMINILPEQHCTINEYDSEDRLISVREVSPEGNTRPREEFFYVNNVLNEKKVYTYYHPQSDPNTRVNVMLVKYFY